jgi:transposase
VKTDAVDAGTLAQLLRADLLPEAYVAPRALRDLLRAARRGRQIAKVAVARKILALCFYSLRDGEIRCLKAPDRASAMKVMAA